MRRYSNRKLSIATRRRGVTAVEMAFAAPIVFLLILGLMEIAYGFMVQHLIQDSARQGCRAAICHRSTNTQVLETVNGLLHGEGIVNAQTTIMINNTPGDISQAKTGDDIGVQISIATGENSILPFYRFLVGEQKAVCNYRLE